jgi:outer membrane protein OmpA-like peptidoglycan-associated protein
MSKKLMKSVVAASVALIGISSGAAYAADGYANDNGATVIKNNYGECWRSGSWAEKNATEECDSHLLPPKPVAAPAPAPVVAEAPKPVVAPPPPPAPKYEKLTYRAEALFAFNSAKLSDKGKKELAEFADKVKAEKAQRTDDPIRIVGHTDRIGSDKANEKLALARANAVRELAIARGVEAPDAAAHAGRGDRPAPPARRRQAAAPGLRVGHAAFDDPLGPAGRRQDHAGAADGRCFDAEFVALSAVFSGVKDIREAMQQAEVMAQQGRRTILFVDEVHRFNKAQQDAFLPYVERHGDLHRRHHREPVLRGEFRAALACRGVCAEEPDEANWASLFDRARAGYFGRLEFDADARERLIGHADGDARRLLNVLEQVRTAAATNGKSGAVSSAPTFWSRRWRPTCAASTRAAMPSTTRSRPCTNRCAAPIRMPRCTGWCACSTAAPIRSTWGGASCAWPSRTSAWPTRAPGKSR